MLMNQVVECGHCMLCSHVSKWLGTKVQNHMPERFQEVTFKERVETVRNHCIKKVETSVASSVLLSLILSLLSLSFFNLLCFRPTLIPLVLCACFFLSI